MADLYFKWLVDKVCRSNLSETHSESFENNDVVFTLLYNRIFTYDKVVMDSNRAADALELRDRFMMESGIVSYYFENDEPSILEVLVALALRCEETIMGDLKVDRTYKWFWLMINNLGIRSCKDESYIQHALDVFIKRTYNFDGTDGGLFHVNNPRNDLRKTEIWYQMCWYLSENYV